jgi:hypothetical protein
LSVSRTDRAKTLDSLHSVEAAAGAAGPPRPDEWRDDLLATLDYLAGCCHEEHLTSAGDDSLLGQVMLSAPHLAPAIKHLRERHLELDDRINLLRMELADNSRSIDVAATRSELTEIAAMMRELRSWETDIVYEAYSVDLGSGE